MAQEWGIPLQTIPQSKTHKHSLFIATLLAAQASNLGSIPCSSLPLFLFYEQPRVLEHTHSIKLFSVDTVYDEQWPTKNIALQKNLSRSLLYVSQRHKEQGYIQE